MVTACATILAVSWLPVCLGVTAPVLVSRDRAVVCVQHPEVVVIVIYCSFNEVYSAVVIIKTAEMASFCLAVCDYKLVILIASLPRPAESGCYTVVRCGVWVFGKEKLLRLTTAKQICENFTNTSHR